jgi:hypothetical protein
MKAQRHGIGHAILFTVVTAGSALAQSAEVDYILIDRMDQTRIGSVPVGDNNWVLPGGGCLTIVGPGFNGSNPTRTRDDLVAIGYNNGPNGVKEWGGGDDLALGNVSAAWAVTTTGNEAHSGQFCLTDSPAGLYQSNRNLSATIAGSFSLVGRADIDLYFFHHWKTGYSTSATCYVEVRSNGGAWVEAKQYRYVGGWHGSYLPEAIDLSTHSGQSIELRFRIQTTGGSPGDGWHLDDLRLIADGEVLFVEDFETGTNGWTLDAPWGLAGNFTDTPYLSGDSLSRDRFGNVLCTVNASTGELLANPVTVPTGTRQGMGYSWVTASAGLLTDGILVYNGAPEYMPE